MIPFYRAIHFSGGSWPIYILESRAWKVSILILTHFFHGLSCVSVPPTSNVLQFYRVIVVPNLAATYFWDVNIKLWEMNKKKKYLAIMKLFTKDLFYRHLEKWRYWEDIPVILCSKWTSITPVDKSLSNILLSKVSASWNSLCSSWSEKHPFSETPLDHILPSGQ